jgi:Phosphorylase superfamily
VSQISRLPTILVPQGAEYQAVCRGLSSVTDTLKPNVLAIPVGGKSVTTYLQKNQENFSELNHSLSRVLVMGLCGSLNPCYSVGDIVLYENCLELGNDTSLFKACEPNFNSQLYSQLPHPQCRLFVKALTSDRVISTASEKRHLGGRLGVDVVDMEGFAVLDFFHQAAIDVAMLRVVSDDCHHDIPDLSSAINSDGSLQPIPLAIAMLRQPIAATRLIRGSLRGLKVLEQVTKLIFQG